MIKKNPFVIGHKIGDKVFCRDVKNRRWHIITGVGVDIWNIILEENNCISDIVKRISSKYKRPIHELENDVGCFLRLLNTNKLISTTESVFAKKSQYSSEENNHSNLSGLDVVLKLADEALKSNIILKADLSLTYKCPLKCKHCYAGHLVEKPRPRQELAIGEIKEIINTLVLQGCFEICLSGGDPFFKQGVIELLDLIKEIDCFARILTSGYRLTPELIEALGNNPHINDVEVSLFGTSRESHEFVTQVPGSFNSSCGTIKNLTSKGIRTIIKFVIMQRNINEARDVPKLAEDLGSNYCYSAGLIYPRLDFDRSPQKLMAGSEELVNYYVWLKEKGYSLKFPRFSGHGERIVL